MKKNAFTLIELLAVIVILAIISIIAVPIVINIINDAKDESGKRSVDLYIDAVEKAIIKQNLKGKYNPDTCNIQNDGNLICKNNNEDLYVEGGNKILKIEMKGKNPSEGTIYFTNGKIIAYKNFKIDGIYFHKNDNGEETITFTKKYATLISDTDNNKKISIGDKYEYQVNDSNKFNFYVLSIEEGKVNLIMDRNICEDGTVEYTSTNNYCNYKWYSRSSTFLGPVDAMTILGNATRNWTNVLNMNLTYDDKESYKNTKYGYTGITITDGIGYITNKNGTQQTPITLIDNLPIKARLPKKSEVSGNDAGCYIWSTSTAYGTCNYWLVENLYYDEVGFNSWCTTCLTKYEVNKTSGVTNEIKGYWLLSSNLFSSYEAYYVRNQGYVYDIDANYENGIRPVITIPISYLN